MGEEAQNAGTRVGGGAQETRPSKSTGSKNSHRLRQRTQDLQESASDEF